MPHGAALGTTLRSELTLILRRLAVAGHIPDSGTRELRIRINDDHSIAWLEPTVIRMPASVLDHSFELPSATG